MRERGREVVVNILAEFLLNIVLVRNTLSVFVRNAVANDTFPWLELESTAVKNFSDLGVFYGRARGEFLVLLLLVVLQTKKISVIGVLPQTFPKHDCALCSNAPASALRVQIASVRMGCNNVMELHSVAGMKRVCVYCFPRSPASYDIMLLRFLSNSSEL